MIFVDTNYFLRFFLKDNSDQYKQVKKLFDQAATGQVKLASSAIAFFEIYWVLSSLYGRSSPLVSNILKSALDMDFIFLPYRHLLKDCLINIAFFNYDLEDAFNFLYAHKKHFSDFATFDEKLKNKFNQIKV